MNGRPFILRAMHGKQQCIIMQINGKNEEGLGRGRKKDDRGGFIGF